MCIILLRLSLRSASTLLSYGNFFDVDPKCGMMCKFRVIRYHLTEMMTAGPWIGTPDICNCVFVHVCVCLSVWVCLYTCLYVYLCLCMY